MHSLGIGCTKVSLVSLGMCLAALGCDRPRERTVYPQPEPRRTAKLASEPEPRCSREQRAAILTPSTEVIDITCNLDLQVGERIRRPIRFAGDRGANVTIDCNQGGIGDATTLRKDVIRIESEFVYETDATGEADATAEAGKCDAVSGEFITCYDGDCDGEHCKIAKRGNGYYQRLRPENIVIRGCDIIGNVRIRGLGRNGQGTWVKKSARDESTPGHTLRARDAAPTNILFDNVKLTANMLYLAPGVTNFTLRDSTLIGGYPKGDSPDGGGIYFDAESYGNVLENNVIDATGMSGKRELLALDGSSGNLIIDNRFMRPVHGGIFLYRNCGEKGAIRVAPPQHNRIVNNYFDFDESDSNKAVFLGSRNGTSRFCDEDADPERAYGSSKDDRDFARYNVVMQNQMLGRDWAKVILTNNTQSHLPDAIKDLPLANLPNYVAHNERVSAHITRQAGCFLETRFDSDFIEHGRAVDQVVDDHGVATCHRFECNDGRLDDVGSCSALSIPFDCTALPDNAGCTASPSCPAGTHVIAAKAACNLKNGNVTAENANGLRVGWVDVADPSDRIEDGLCTVATTSVKDRADIIRGPSVSSSIAASCSRRDGGKCAVWGTLYCR